MIARVARGLAIAGCGVLLATASLTTFSVARRWLTSQPVRGDFELVSLGAGVAVLGCLAWGTVRGANIVVDSLTGWLPAGVTRAIDAGWSLVWAAVAGVLAWRLGVGARDTWASGTTTMALGLPTWWAVGLGAVAFGVVALAALRQVVRPGGIEG